jgi:hypothetical protein
MSKAERVGVAMVLLAAWATNVLVFVRVLTHLG